jgi:hypothetical protein
MLPIAQGCDGCWKYKGGESHLVSIPYNFLYSDLMHRLSEKTDQGVSAKFLQPTEALDPENLISIRDNDDVQVRPHTYPERPGQQQQHVG